MRTTLERKILIVDDEKDIVDLLKYNLEKEGYEVITALDGQTAIEYSSQNPDLILLDVMLPEVDGFEVIKMIKKQKDTENIPVIFLTAKGSEIDEVLGLELGADDYIVKPISIPKLLARVKTVLKKYGSRKEITSTKKTIKIGVLEIDPVKYRVFIDQKEIFFPKKEFELLYYLAQNTGKILTRENILNSVWGSNVYIVDRTIDVHIRKIREKMGKYGDYIETIKSVGYRMKEL
ncbi:MAG: Phosphate regulon transcriptional regulatory protein PhoB (SphR) [Ignavibacteriae bacterium]|nr:MAG: Phosphate regulon transcriptional regulatory protein PhoB (SphR) [Ignavibacteriota bacterium]